jgi:hypothetical protein
MKSAKKSIRRAIIVRNSPDEKNDDKHSPEVQEGSIRDFCQREGWELLDVLYEIDVSGNWELERRTGLSRAVAMVEAREADVVIVARFDRMIRNTRVQAEITERVETGGRRPVRHRLRLHHQRQRDREDERGVPRAGRAVPRDTTRERSAEGVQAAIDAGIPPFKGATAGYLRPIVGVRRNGKPIHGPLVPDPKTKDAVAQAWAMRAEARPSASAARSWPSTASSTATRA